MWNLQQTILRFMNYGEGPRNYIMPSQAADKQAEKSASEKSSESSSSKSEAKSDTKSDSKPSSGSADSK